MRLRHALPQLRRKQDRLFFDEDTWRALRALRTHRDPAGLVLANHEIKDSQPEKRLLPCSPSFSAAAAVSPAGARGR